MLLTINANFYLGSRPKISSNIRLILNLFGLLDPNKNDTGIEKLENNETAKNSKLIFHMNYFTSVQRFCIFSNLAIKIIIIVYRNRYSDFAKYYKIVARLGYIQSLVKHPCFYI